MLTPSLQKIKEFSKSYLCVEFRKFSLLLSLSSLIWLYYEPVVNEPQCTKLKVFSISTESLETRSVDHQVVLWTMRAKCMQVYSFKNCYFFN